MESRKEHSFHISYNMSCAVSTANRGHGTAACQALGCALAGAAAAAAERPAPARELSYPRNVYKSLAEAAQDTRLLRKDCCPASLAPSCSRTHKVKYISVHTQNSAQRLMALPQYTSSLLSYYKSVVPCAPAQHPPPAGGPAPTAAGPLFERARSAVSQRRCTSSASAKLTSGGHTTDP